MKASTGRLGQPAIGEGDQIDQEEVVTQVVQAVFSKGRPAEPWSEDEHRQAVEGLFTLLEEFFEYLAGPDDATSQTI